MENQYIYLVEILFVSTLTPTPRSFGSRPYIRWSRIRNGRHVNKT